MPMVNGKKFEYSKKGKEMAKAYAKKSGMKIMDKKKMMKKGEKKK